MAIQAQSKNIDNFVLYDFTHLHFHLISQRNTDFEAVNAMGIGNRDHIEH